GTRPSRPDSSQDSQSRPRLEGRRLFAFRRQRRTALHQQSTQHNKAPARSLKQRLIEDMKAAMKSGDKHSLGVIRLANAAIKQREVDERIELDDAQVLAVLEKMVKQRRDSVSQFEAADREDLAKIERDEIVVVERYLPAKLDEA